jgi:hypothetical protein
LASGSRDCKLKVVMDEAEQVSQLIGDVYLARHRAPELRALRESYPFPSRSVVDASRRRAD